MVDNGVCTQGSRRQLIFVVCLLACLLISRAQQQAVRTVTADINESHLDGTVKLLRNLAAAVPKTNLWKASTRFPAALASRAGQLAARLERLQGGGAQRRLLAGDIENIQQDALDSARLLAGKDAEAAMKAPGVVPKQMQQPETWSRSAACEEARHNSSLSEAAVADICNPDVPWPAAEARAALEMHASGEDAARQMEQQDLGRAAEAMGAHARAAWAANSAQQQGQARTPPKQAGRRQALSFAPAPRRAAMPAGLTAARPAPVRAPPPGPRGSLVRQRRRWHQVSRAACRQAARETAHMRAPVHQQLTPQLARPASSAQLWQSPAVPDHGGGRRHLMELNCQDLGSWKDFLGGYVATGCYEISCLLPFGPFFAVKFKIDVCLRYLEMLNAGWVNCLLTKCDWSWDSVGLQILQDMVNVLEGARVSVSIGFCFNTSFLKTILDLLNLADACLNARLQAWVLKSQIAAQVELTLFIAWIGIRVKVQEKPGAWNPVCAGLKAVRPDLYDAVLKCQDYCAWDAGGADVEWLWGIRILWFRKQWVYKIAGSDIPKCDYPADCPAGRYRPRMDRCADCGPGSYTYDSNQQQCTPAPKGHFCPGYNSTTATPCPAGTFQPSQGMSTCQPCPPGSFSSAGLGHCTHCPPGSYSRSGADDCTKCSPGSYAVDPGAATCSPCPEGTAAGTPGAASCIECQAGTAAPAGAVNCTACSPGHYQDSARAATCKACDAGTASSEVGRTQTCDACRAGSVAPAGAPACTPCAPGSWQGSNRQAQCIQCTPGTASNSVGRAMSCDKCQPGWISRSAGATSCESCNHAYRTPTYEPLPGYYQDESGQSKCKRCAAGTEVARRQAYDIGTACRPCPPGKFERGSVCVNCPVGTHNQLSGATSQDACLPCPPNTYSEWPAASCTPCPRGTWAAVPSWQCSDCGGYRLTIRSDGAFCCASVEPLGYECFPAPNYPPRTNSTNGTAH